MRHTNQYDLPEEACDRAVLLGGVVVGQQAEDIVAVNVAAFQDIHPAPAPVLFDYLQV